MKRLILLMCLVMVCGWAFADEERYRSTLVVTKLVKVENAFGDYLKLDLPFNIYGVNIVCEGADVTYNMSNMKLEGKEVVAKVDYKIKDQALVDKFVGNIGSTWKDVQTDAAYIKHYNHTKEDALATYTDNQDGSFTKVPYIGIDKDELVKFTQWEEK